MNHFDLADSVRGIRFERKLPMPPNLVPPPAIKLTPARCLKAFAGVAGFSALALWLALERYAQQRDLLIAAVLAYVGLTNALRAGAVLRVYVRVARGEKLYIHPSRRTRVPGPVSSAAVIMLTL